MNAMLSVTSALAVLALTLASCGPAQLVEQDYHISHPLTAQKEEAVAVLDGPFISEFDSDRLRRMAAESLRRGAGPMVVTVQTRAGGENEATLFADQIATALRQQGVHNVVVTMRIEADRSLEAIVRAPIWVAVASECGTFTRGLNPDHDNAPNSNWGCSVQRNTALMLQNPADLIRARESSGRDANRSVDVLGKYGRGEATSSEAEDMTAGSTSTVGSSGK